MAIKLECVHADTCLPDYWSGHHLAHVQIPVYPRMKLKDIKQELHNEINQGAIAGSDETATLLMADWLPDDQVKVADQAVKAAHAAINRIKPNKKGQRVFFTDLEEPDDDSETVYAFFVFREI